MHYLSSSLHIQSKENPAPAFEAAFLSASPGCQLAMAESHDIIREDDPLAEYYGEVGTKVARSYSMEEKDVAAGTFLVIGQLQERNQSIHPDQVLVAALDWLNVPSEQTGQKKFFEFLLKYKHARENQKSSHAQACVALLGKCPDDAKADP